MIVLLGINEFIQRVDCLNILNDMSRQYHCAGAFINYSVQVWVKPKVKYLKYATIYAIVW